MPGQVGLGVDATGGPVIDPTKNVLDLTAAANKRQDDLREMYNRFMGAEIKRLEEIVKRVEETSELRANHAREIAIIHQAHDRDIHSAEQDKLNAIRNIDVLARNTEADRNLAAIEVLARTTQTNADNLRNALDATASTIAKQNAETNSEIYQRLAALEKSSYEGAGKGTGAKNIVTYAIVAVGLLVSLITIGSVVVGIAFAIKR